MREGGVFEETEVVESIVPRGHWTVQKLFSGFQKLKRKKCLPPAGVSSSIPECHRGKSYLLCRQH